jgi:hypothetical protein
MDRQREGLTELTKLSHPWHVGLMERTDSTKPICTVKKIIKMELSDCIEWIVRIFEPSCLPQYSTQAPTSS